MRQRNLDLALAIVGVAGIVALFMPFSDGVSPMDAIDDQDLRPLALPFFLAVPILIASIRLAFTDSLSTSESAVAYIAGGIAALYLSYWILSVVIDQFDETTKPGDWFSFMTPIAIFVLGVYLLIRDGRKKRLRGFRPLLALQAAYIGNAIFCMLAIANDFGWQTGAYLSLVATIAYLVQIVLACTRPRQSAVAAQDDP